MFAFISIDSVPLIHKHVETTIGKHLECVWVHETERRIVFQTALQIAKMKKEKKIPKPNQWRKKKLCREVEAYIRRRRRRVYSFRFIFVRPSSSSRRIAEFTESHANIWLFWFSLLSRFCSTVSLAHSHQEPQQRWTLWAFLFVFWWVADAWI